MGEIRKNWPCSLLLLILVFASCSLSEARSHHHKLSSVVVVGTVYCHACLQDDISKATHYISGATVAVECKEGNSRPAFYQEVQTDNQGTFKIPLPFSVRKHVTEIKGCNVKLVKSSDANCAVISTSSSSAIHLKETKTGKQLFSAELFTFKQPGLCNLEPSKKVLEEKEQVLQPQQFFPPIIQPPPTLLPPNPLQPAPLVPNPFQPPAPPLIPNPFQPPAPPSGIFPPLPPLPPLPQVPPLPSFPLPAVPGLPPVLVSPPPPSFRLPPLPFVPLPPLIPGIPMPPASNNPKKETP